MFIAALFTTAKMWKQPKCPLTDEWIKMWWDIPSGPVVKTRASNAGGAGLIPGRELRSHMPRGQKTKQKNNTHRINGVF